MPKSQLQLITTAMFALVTLSMMQARASLGQPPVPTNAVQFPWCPDSGNALAAPAPKPYRIMNPMPAEPYRLEIMPPKQTYRYGWFGHNPTSHWTRHFGTSRNFTQWSLD